MKDDSTLRVCPYLGLASDASIWRRVATGAHRCHRWATPQTVEEERQSSYCLSDSHLKCPWFVRPDGSLSARRERHRPVSRSRRVVAVVALVAVLALAFVAARMLLWPGCSEGEGAKAAAGAPASTATTGVPGEAAPEAAFQATTPLGASSPAPSSVATPAPPDAQSTTLPDVQRPTAAPGPTAAPSRPTSTPATASPGPTVPSGYQVYEIREGDTLYGLARSFGVTVEDIMRANGLTDRAMVRVGQRLLIPPPRQ